MSLSIQDNFVKDLENFTWEKDWRATRIIKEKRVGGEFYFANIIRYYGEKDDSKDYDIGDTYAETAWLGRNEKFVGKRKWDTDHDSKTFGERINSPAVTEEITVADAKGKPVKREVLIEGKTIYEYTIPVTKENTEKIKKLAGATSLNQETQLLFIYGAAPPLVVDPDVFWSTTVSQYLQDIKPKTNKVDNGKKT